MHLSPTPTLEGGECGGLMEEVRKMREERKNQFPLTGIVWIIFYTYDIYMMFVIYKHTYKHMHA